MQRKSCNILPLCRKNFGFHTNSPIFGTLVPVWTTQKKISMQNIRLCEFRTFILWLNFFDHIKLEPFQISYNESDFILQYIFGYTHNGSPVFFNSSYMRITVITICNNYAKVINIKTFKRTYNSWQLISHLWKTFAAAFTSKYIKLHVTQFTTRLSISWCVVNYSELRYEGA